MSWADVCWDSLAKWPKLGMLHCDNVAHLKQLTHEVARKLEELLVGTHRIEPVTTPTFFVRSCHGNAASLYVQSHKLACESGGEPDQLAQQLAEIVVSRPGDVFSPYQLIIPGDCDGSMIKRGRYLTRFAVWAGDAA